MGGPRRGGRLGVRLFRELCISSSKRSDSSFRRGWLVQILSEDGQKASRCVLPPFAMQRLDSGCRRKKRWERSVAGEGEKFVKSERRRQANKSIPSEFCSKEVCTRKQNILWLWPGHPWHMARFPSFLPRIPGPEIRAHPAEGPGSYKGAS